MLAAFFAVGPTSQGKRAERHHGVGEEDDEDFHFSCGGWPARRRGWGTGARAAPTVRRGCSSTSWLARSARGPTVSSFSRASSRPTRRPAAAAPLSPSRSSSSPRRGTEYHPPQLERSWSVFRFALLLPPIRFPSYWPSALAAAGAPNPTLIYLVACQLLREINHENVVKLVNVHINHADMSLYLAFDYAEHDLYVCDGVFNSFSLHFLSPIPNWLTKPTKPTAGDYQASQGEAELLH